MTEPKFGSHMEVLGVAIGEENPFGTGIPDKQLQRVQHAHQEQCLDHYQWKIIGHAIRNSIAKMALWEDDETIAVRHKWWGSEGSLVLGRELSYQNAVIVLNNGHYFLARTHQAPSSC